MYRGYTNRFPVGPALMPNKMLELDASKRGRWRAASLPASIVSGVAELGGGPRRLTAKPLDGVR